MTAEILMLAGAITMLLAALGLVRMPDLFTRMQTTTKASTLGVALVLIGAAVHFGAFETAARAALGIVFSLLTAPVAAHAIARSAFHAREPLWEGTVTDESDSGAPTKPRS